MGDFKGVGSRTVAESKEINKMKLSKECGKKLVLPTGSMYGVRSVEYSLIWVIYDFMNMTAGAIIRWTFSSKARRNAVRKVRLSSFHWKMIFLMLSKLK